MRRHLLYFWMMLVVVRGLWTPWMVAGGIPTLPTPDVPALASLAVDTADTNAHAHHGSLPRSVPPPPLAEHHPLPPDAAATPSSAPHDHGAGCAQCEICHTAGILPSGTPWATDPAPRSPPTSPRLSYTSAPSALADKPPIA